MRSPNPKFGLLILALLSLLVAWRAIELVVARSAPVDAMLVLGGTPIRERFAAQLEREHPDRKILISAGSEDPCIWLMFDRARAPKTNVWMENCSHNTLQNFMYAVPILEHWRTRKVLLLTEEPHLQRALPMAQVILGAHGMWVDLLVVPDSGGEPLKRPVWIDIVLACGWAIVSQVFGLPCDHLTHLPDVDMKYWYQHGFYCAPQAEVRDYRP